MYPNSAVGLLRPGAVELCSSSKNGGPCGALLLKLKTHRRRRLLSNSPQTHLLDAHPHHAPPGGGPQSAPSDAGSPWRGFGVSCSSGRVRDRIAYCGRGRRFACGKGLKKKKKMMNECPLPEAHLLPNFRPTDFHWRFRALGISAFPSRHRGQRTFFRVLQASWPDRLGAPW